MKATMTMLVVLLVVAGMGLVGDAFAQPDDPPAAASEDSGDGSAADDPKPDPAPTTEEADEASTSEDKSSESKKDKEEAKKAPEDLASQGKIGYSAAKNGDWMILVSIIMMMLGTAARWIAGKKWGFLKSKAGGYSVAIAMGLGILGTGMYEVGFSLGLLMNAALVTSSSMGLYGASKDAKETLKPAAA